MSIRPRFLALTLTLLGVAAETAVAAEAARCSPTPLADLDLRESPQGFLLPVEIGGKPVWLALRTEFNVLMLAPEALPLLQLEPVLIGNSAPASVRIGGTVVTHRTTVKTLQAGTHHYNPVVAGVTPVSVTDPAAGGDASALPMVDGRPVVGEFGTELLSRTDFELDLAARKLRLFSIKHCRNMGAYWTPEYAQARFDRDHFGGIYFGLELDGKLVETTISTRRPVSMLDAEIARIAYGAGDAPESTRTMTLALPGLALGQAEVTTFERGGEGCGYVQRINSGVKAIGYGRCLGTFPLTLGRDVVERLRFYFSHNEQKVYVTPTAAPR